MRVEALGHNCRQPRPTDRPAETLGNLQLSIESPDANFTIAKPVKVTRFIRFNDFLPQRNSSCPSCVWSCGRTAW